MSAFPLAPGVLHPDAQAFSLPRPAPPQPSSRWQQPQPLARRRRAHCAEAPFSPARAHRHRHRRLAVRAATAGQAAGDAQRVVVVGGTGRVGSSAAKALKECRPDLEIVLVSRSRKSYEGAVRKFPTLKGLEFVSCDIRDPDALDRLLAGAALVMHCAGPFQGKRQCTVLEAAMRAKVPYMDVCDDREYSEIAKRLHGQAQAAGIPALTTAGIYPGTSNVMAAYMIGLARGEIAPPASQNASQNGAGAEAQPKEQRRRVEPKRVLYSYYTAGSGGVGPTILETSLLLAAEPVTVYKDGQKVIAEPVSEPRTVDFGKPIGQQLVWLYSLPEVESTHHYLKVPSVSARFATAPALWNWAMVAVARFVPRKLIQSQSRLLARLSDPWVRLLDPIIGEAVGMLVEVELDDGTTAAGLYVHKRLSDCVGNCLAGFAVDLLKGNTPPGVWLPEEPEALSDQLAYLQHSAQGCLRFELNKPLWALETEPKRLAFGMYV